MSDADYRTIQALNRCTFYPGSWVKRFVRDLAAYPREKQLTLKQQAALARVAWHYRVQLSRHGIIVETRPDGVGPDQSAVEQRDLDALKAWNEVAAAKAYDAAARHYFGDRAYTNFGADDE